MANPMKGEASLGKHKLIVNFNGFCTLEGVLGKTTSELIAMMATGVGFGLKELRACVRVFLDKEMPASEVGELIEQLGMTEVPNEDRRLGDPETNPVWVAAQALNTALEGYFAAQREGATKNPPATE